MTVGRGTGAVLVAALTLAGCGGEQVPDYAAPTVIPDASAAPDFELADAGGRRVRLSGLRGRPILLAFLYTRCPDVCPLITDKLKAALDRLGSGSNVAVVAVSVDPKGDTPRAVRSYLHRHRMAGRMEYLIGSRVQLARVWRAYGVGVEDDPDSRDVGHSSSVFGITAAGKKRTAYLYSFEPSEIVHDVPVLGRD